MSRKQGTNKAVARAEKKRARGGPKKHHGAGTGKNRDHLVVPCKTTEPCQITAEVLRLKATKCDASGQVLGVEHHAEVIVHGTSVDPGTQRKLAKMKVRLSAMAG